MDNSLHSHLYKINIKTFLIKCFIRLKLIKKGRLILKFLSLWMTDFKWRGFACCAPVGSVQISLPLPSRLKTHTDREKEISLSIFLKAQFLPWSVVSGEYLNDDYYITPRREKCNKTLLHLLPTYDTSHDNWLQSNNKII